MADPRGGWRVDRARLTAGSALLVVATFVVATTVRNLFAAAHRTLGWVVASSVVALLLAPVVGLLSRRMKRGLAIGLTMVATLWLVGGVAAGVAVDLRQQVDRLREDLPAAADAIEESDSGTGEAARDFELEDRVGSFVEDFDDRMSQRAAAEGALDTAPTYFLNAILVVFFLVFGGRTGRSLLRQFSDPERRDRIAEVTAGALARGQRYILAALAQAAVAGLVTGGLAWWAELPAPAVLGVVMAALALVPYFGVLLGAIPVVLLAGGFNPGWVTVLLLAGLVVLQLASALTMRAIGRRSVRVGPAVVVVVTLVGFDVYGFGGAFCGTALAVFAVAALDVATGRVPVGPGASRSATPGPVGSGPAASGAEPAAG